MLDLSTDLFTVEQGRQVDAAAAAHGLPAPVLTARAGTASYHLLRTRYPEARAVGVLCGPGNNGGDGYVLAELARRDGLQVTLAAIGEPRPGSAAAQARAQYRGVVTADVHAAAAAPVRVDALLGTGLSRAPTGPIREAIEVLGASPGPILSLDVPSGLDADTGAAPGVAVQADATLSFVVRKRGLYTGRARALAGALSCDDLGIPPAARAAVGAPGAGLLGLAVLMHRYLPARARNTHKGHCGHVLIIGGEHGYGGAVRLAGEAALRAGAGLVTVATRAVHVPAIIAGRPELMVHAVAGAAALRPLLARADAVVVGPGLGQGPWGRALARAALEASGPLVVDADALNLLARAPRTRGQWVLTPHPGEAARLLGCDIAAVERDRYAAVRTLATRFGAVALLKGPGTLVTDGAGPVGVCPYGGPVLASGGTGDVLAGLVGGLVAQGVPLLEAAALGACVHGAAGDRLAARCGERGVLAGELCASLPDVLNDGNGAGVRPA